MVTWVCGTPSGASAKELLREASDARSVEEYVLAAVIPRLCKRIQQTPNRDIPGIAQVGLPLPPTPPPPPPPPPPARGAGKALPLGITRRLSSLAARPDNPVAIVQTGV